MVDVKKLLVFKSLLTTPCNVLPLHLKKIRISNQIDIEIDIKLRGKKNDRSLL